MKQLIKWVTSLAVAASLAACGGGGGSPGATSGSGGGTALATTAPSSVTVQVGGAETYTISGGAGGYTAVSDNTGVAVGAVSGNTLTIGAVSPGTANVTVIDAKNNKVVVGVTSALKPLSTTAPGSITLANGEVSSVFTIKNGMAPYGVISTNQSIARVQQLTPTTFDIVGVNTGATSVVVTDGVGGSSTVSVTVSPALALFTTAPTALSLNVGNNVTYSISGGTAPYTVMSGNPNVVAVSQPTPTTFKVTAVSNGSGSVVVQDALGTKVTVSVTVSAVPIVLNPSTANTIIGITNYAYITGGVAPYTALSSFAGVATVDVGKFDSSGAFQSDPNGNVLKMVANQVASPNQIIVTDSLGNRGSFALTSSAGSTTFTFAPNTLTVSACTQTPITLSMLGGAASSTPKVFSSDTSMFTISASGNTATITPLVKPLVDGAYTFTAVDANGATAIATVTVVAPNGACP